MRPSVACLLHWRANDLIPYVQTGPRRRYRFDPEKVYNAIRDGFPNQFHSFVKSPNPENSPPVLEWNRGPALNGDASWSDGDRLIIVISDGDETLTFIVFAKLNHGEMRFFNDVGHLFTAPADQVRWWAKVD